MAADQGLQDQRTDLAATVLPRDDARSRFASAASVKFRKTLVGIGQAAGATDTSSATACASLSYPLGSPSNANANASRH